MGDWVSEFPNDNPELFSQHPPGMPEDELVDACCEAPVDPPVEAPEAPIEDEIGIEVVDAFEESDFENATLESIEPLADAREPMVEPIRRALRSRGVCAFGLVVEAA